MESSGVQPSHSLLCPQWCETRLLEAYFQNREQVKDTRSEMQRVRWLGEGRTAFLSKELVHNKRCVALCVLVMQKPHGTNFALTSLIFKSSEKSHEWIRERCQRLVPTPLWSFFDYIESVVALFQSEEMRKCFDCPTYKGCRCCRVELHVSTHTAVTFEHRIASL